jgi:hypothetical protein
MGRRQSLGPMWRIWPWLTRTSRVALPPTSALYYAQRLDLVHQNSQQPCEFARVAARYRALALSWTNAMGTNSSPWAPIDRTARPLVSRVPPASAARSDDLASAEQPVSM